MLQNLAIFFLLELVYALIPNLELQTKKTFKSSDSGKPSRFSINKDGNFLPLFPSRQQPEHQMLVKKHVLLEALDLFSPSSKEKTV